MNIQNILRKGFTVLVALSLALPGVALSLPQNYAWANNANTANTGGSAARASVSTAPKTLSEAKANLDAATASKDDAAAKEASAKQSLAENNAKRDAAQNAYNQAAAEAAKKKAEAEEALAQLKASTEQEFQTALSNAEKALDAYTEANQALSNAEQNIKDAEAAIKQAEELYNSLAAGMTTDSANTALNTATNNLKNAEAAYQEALKTYNDTLKAIDEKQESLNTLTKQKEQAQAEFDAVNTEWQAAKTAKDEAQIALDSAKAKFSAAEAQAASNRTQAENEAHQATLDLAASQAKAALDAAQAEFDSANSRLEAVTAAFDNATKVLKQADDIVAAKYNLATVDKTALKEKVDSAKAAAESAQAAYTAAVNQHNITVSYKEAKAKKDKFEKQKTDQATVLATAESTLTNSVKSLQRFYYFGYGETQDVNMKGFFENFTSQFPNLQKFINKSLPRSSSTTFGLFGDTTTMSCAKESIAMMDEANEVRTELGLNSLSVELNDLATMMYELNYAAATYATATPDTDYVTGVGKYFHEGELWSVKNLYTAQKATWDAAISNNSYLSPSTSQRVSLPSGWAEKDDDYLDANCKEFYKQISFYKSIINPANNMISIATNRYDETNFKTLFNIKSSASSNLISVASYKSKVESYNTSPGTPLEPLSAASISAQSSGNASVLSPTAIPAGVSPQTSTADAYKYRRNSAATAQKEYLDAKKIQDENIAAIAAAESEMNAAMVVRDLEEAKDDTATNYRVLNTLYQAVANPSGDVNSESHPINVARKEAFDAKSELLTRKNNVPTNDALKTALENKKADYNAKNNAATNYKAFTEKAATFTAANLEFSRLDPTYQEKNNTLTDITSQLSTLNTDIGVLNTAKPTHESNVNTKRQESETAKTAMGTQISDLDESSSYVKLYNAKTTLDSKRTGYTDLLASIPAIKKSIPFLESSKNSTATSQIAAQAKLDAVNAVTIDKLLTEPLYSQYTELVTLSNNVAPARSAYASAQTASASLATAQAAASAALNTYNLQKANYESAVVALENAQSAYNNFGSNAGSTDTPTWSVESGEPDWYVEPGQPAAPKAKPAVSKVRPTGKAKPAASKAKPAVSKTEASEASDEKPSENTTNNVVVAPDDTPAASQAPASPSKTINSEKPSVGPSVSPMVIIAGLFAAGVALIAAGATLMRRRAIQAAGAAATGVVASVANADAQATASAPETAATADAATTSAATDGPTADSADDPVTDAPAETADAAETFATAADAPAKTAEAAETSATAADAPAETADAAETSATAADAPAETADESAQSAPSDASEAAESAETEQ